MTLILGGARSGKSTYAQTLAETSEQPVLYVATAQAGDEEMAARIQAHRASRPAHWTTLEAPLQVGESIAREMKNKDYAVVLIDCFTLLASNVLVSFPDSTQEQIIDNAVNQEIETVVNVFKNGSAHWILVSNEVGLGLVPPYPMGRIYRDMLGRVNQHLASVSDEVIFMVAGLPMQIKSAKQ